jgi:hypothetical protein
VRTGLTSDRDFTGCADHFAELQSAVGHNTNGHWPNENSSPPPKVRYQMSDLQLFIRAFVGFTALALAGCAAYGIDDGYVSRELNSVPRSKLELTGSIRTWEGTLFSISNPGKEGRSGNYFLVAGTNETEFVVTRIDIILRLVEGPDEKVLSTQSSECSVRGGIHLKPGDGSQAETICGFQLSSDANRIVREKPDFDLHWSARFYGHRKPIRLVAYIVDPVLSGFANVVSLFDRVD